ncbi:MAG: flagellar biosynthetic protein FliO, partial [Siculibacillus sp.]|nr:flagellar biosynthetic protein FliO [Siculibacillus sp.]
MGSLRDWLNTQFGADGGRAVQMILALIVVVLLLVLLAWLFRRFSGRMHFGGRGQRLSVVDAAPVDGRRRLLLLRRDDVEHLVMVGGPNDLLVESRILKGPPTVGARPVGPVVAQAQPPAAAPPPPEPETSRPLPSAAAIGSALAGAGSFLRSRLSRAEPAPAEAPRRPTRAPMPETSFDEPLGRPVPLDATPVREPDAAARAAELAPVATAPARSAEPRAAEVSRPPREQTLSPRDTTLP